MNPLNVRRSLVASGIRSQRDAVHARNLQKLDNIRKDLQKIYDELAEANAEYEIGTPDAAFLVLHARMRPGFCFFSFGGAPIHNQGMRQKWKDSSRKLTGCGLACSDVATAPLRMSRGTSQEQACKCPAFLGRPLVASKALHHESPENGGQGGDGVTKLRFGVFAT